MKIIIADDNPRMRQLLRTLCATPADTVIECGDGAAAVTAFARHAADWAVLDIVMPVLDGFGALTEIRRHSPAARVVMVTNHADESFRERAQQLGATDFLSKDDLMRLSEILHPPAQS